MAVPVETVSGVEPAAAPPDDYARLQSSPANFGGLIAQGAEKVGAGLDRTATAGLDVATMRAQRFNQIQVDDQFNKFQDFVNKATYGDPNDRETTPGLYSLKGSDALRAGPQAIQALSDQREALRNGLTSQAAQLEFDQQSRRLLQYASGEIGRHLDQQADVYGLATNQAAIKNASDAASNTWNSDQAFNNSQAQARQAAVQAKQIQFGHNLSPELTQAAIREADSQVGSARIMGWSAHDAAGASNWLQNGTMLDWSGKQVPVSQAIDPATYHSLQQHLLTVGDQAGANAVVNQAMGVPGTANTLADAIHQQESGGAATSATSVNGARGGWQITPATFQQYARPGEKIDDQADNEAVGRRIIDDLSQRTGGDPARVAVGYFSGTGNIAPPGSATPWIADKADGNGKTTSSYVRDVMARLRAGSVPGATPDNTAAPLPDYQTAASAVMAATAGNYRQQQMAMAELNRRYAAQKRGTQEAYEQAANPLVSQMIADPTKIDPVRDIAQNPAFNAEQKVNLSNILSKKLADYNTEGNKDEKTYGPQFWNLYRAVTAAPTDPGRINDPQVILKAAGPDGGLTVAGVQKLTEIMAGTRTPEGSSESKMLGAFLAGAKAQISKDGLFGDMKDPQGEARYSEWLTHALPAFDEGKKKGLTAAQMLDPKSKDYIGGSIQSFTRSMPELTRDLHNANGDGGAAAPDLTTREGIRAAYQAGTISRDQAAEALQKAGIWKPPAAAPQVPTSE